MREKNLVDHIDAYFKLAPMLLQKAGLYEEVEAAINYLGEAYMRGMVKLFGPTEKAMEEVRRDFQPHVYNWIANRVLTNGMVICDMALNPPSSIDQGLLKMRLLYALVKADTVSPRFLEFESIDLPASQGRFHMWRTYNRGF